VILNHRAAFTYAYGEGIGATQPAGFGIPVGGNYDADLRALTWRDAQTAVDITPVGLRAARVDDGEQDQYVGSHPATRAPSVHAPSLAQSRRHGGELAPAGIQPVGSLGRFTERMPARTRS
jgi:hypothetical protein